MWMSVFSINEDVDNFVENYENSSFKQALEPFGEWTLKAKSGVSSTFTFQTENDIINFIFSYSFKERILTLRFDTPSQKEEAFYLTLFSEFKKWLVSIDQDCMIRLSTEHFILPATECVVFPSSQMELMYTFSGSDSKQIIELLKQVPSIHSQNTEDTVFYTALPRAFYGAEFLVRFGFYPKPNVAFIYSDGEYGYMKDELLDYFSYKHCFTVEDIDALHQWLTQLNNDTEKTAKQLFSKMNEKKSSFLLEQNKQSVSINGISSCSILPTMKFFDFQYMVHSHGFERRMVSTKEEGIDVILNDLENAHLLYESNRRIRTYIDSFSPMNIKEGMLLCTATFKSDLFAQQLQYDFHYTYEDDGDTTFFYRFQKTDSENFSSILEAEENLKKDIFQYIKEHRARSIFKEKETY